MLQWGRGLLPGCAPAHRHQGQDRWCRFNGAGDCSPDVTLHRARRRHFKAASMGPRMLPGCDTAWPARPGRSMPLQWGRGCSPDVTSGSVRGHFPFDASMGPRMLPGCDDLPAASALLQGWLQWGRGCSPDVTMTCRAAAGRSKRLQWGRGCSPDVTVTSF